jgi:hypothetical protein
MASSGRGTMKMKGQPHFHAFEVTAVVFQKVNEPPKKQAA